jgi:hypothetical protein
MKKSLIVLSVACCFQLTSALDAPVVIIETVDGGGPNNLILNWSAVSGADIYRIYESDNHAGPGNLLAELGADQFNYSLSSNFASRSFFYLMAVDTTVNLNEPDNPAPDPLPDPEDVISLFSNSYLDYVTSTWSMPWDQADLADVLILGNDAKLYTNLNFAGIEPAATIDLTAMTHFHMDVWTPDPTTAPAIFKIKLVDFGPNGVYGGDDSEYELWFDENSLPPLESSNWISYDIPLSDFSGLLYREHFAQLILSGDPSTVYIDNVFFWGEGSGIEPTEPQTPAPLPTEDETEVISIFSNVYPDVYVDTWSADWDQADVEDVQVAADDIKKYSNLNYAGIEFVSQTIFASVMTHFHMDIWTADPTVVPAAFRIKLVDFGADGSWSGGDDVEHELVFDENSNPALQSGSWLSFDIPMSDFAGLTTSAHLAQLLISGDPNTVYVDNIYFYSDGSIIVPPAPAQAAPTPTQNQINVISLFSDIYADAPVDSWSAVWDEADLQDTLISGDAVKQYRNLNFAGIEFTSQTVDASLMAYFHLDIWTPDPTNLPAELKIKLVDFGADGVWQGNDDVEHELTFDRNSNPPLLTGHWMSFDIPFNLFSGLLTRGHLAQLVITADPDVIFIDNVFFYNECVYRSTGPALYSR